jgi:hypothetical protein
MRCIPATSSSRYALSMLACTIRLCHDRPAVGSRMVGDALFELFLSSRPTLADLLVAEGVDIRSNPRADRW